MFANYHTHTPRCNHATGTEDEYIKAALQAGLKTLGFSDHTPYGFPDGYYTHMRMLPQELPGYADTVRLKRKQYQGKLDIHLGLEAEYYPAYFDDLLVMLRDNGIEYLILGQHWSGNEIDEPYNGRPTESEEQLKKYCDQVIEAMNTGVFSYVAHPDLLNYVGDEKIYENHMRRLCREAVSCGIPLEINLLGLGGGRHYPAERFWRIAAQEGNQAVLGADAHSPQMLLDKETETFARSFAANLGIPLMDEITLRRI